MMRSLYSAVSGLQAHQVKMDVIGNNIANINTVGYKKSQVTFQDVLSQLTREATAPGTGETIGGVNPIQIGNGVMIGATTVNHSQGAPMTTGNATDLMIQGEGFFVLKRDNEEYLTRAGTFCFDEKGYLVNSANGMYVLNSGDSGDSEDSEDSKGRIYIKGISEVSSISISANGEVKYIDQDGKSQSAGTIGLAKVSNPAGLKKVGENLYITSANSGTYYDEEKNKKELNKPNEGGTGIIVPMALEMSNVDLSQEFTDMIVTERGFQANSRTIRTVDEILQEIINLKR